MYSTLSGTSLVRLVFLGFWCVVPPSLNNKAGHVDCWKCLVLLVSCHVLRPLKLDEAVEQTDSKRSSYLLGVSSKGCHPGVKDIARWSQYQSVASVQWFTRLQSGCRAHGEPRTSSSFPNSQSNELQGMVILGEARSNHKEVHLEEQSTAAKASGNPFSPFCFFFFGFT